MYSICRLFQATYGVYMHIHINQVTDTCTCTDIHCTYTVTVHVKYSILHTMHFNLVCMYMYSIVQKKR